ncbi:MAG: hypothetical protein A2864_00705 [Candidatus Woykebacteria bacterium RIFCSPHIGHO2_01_FULL_39_12]|uniref:Peptidase M50 domain-containing protein n=2 Tax=Candidatus Woykeibacteriota TaxID=1817899 RepID=A0A1G1WDR9_9BACT|nr:MAG: hypothetical protein A2134_00360 [Candidatus Woykebacteria bacterium RBG_16_39_9b]OGY26989.1 MAG: hypothetical protein A2864_00705 [Candidatus Woykebacteria bacterium RIFCSPHIGHO2_01_FULL_39_12]
MNVLNVSNPLYIFVSLAVLLGVLAIIISIHEASHAWAANKLGDPTAKYQGRITLNPIAHIDLIGTILIPLVLIIISLQTGRLFLFGWAKPTPFNPWNLKHPRRDSALISFAGPASNFIVSAILGLIFRISNVELILPILGLNLILGIFNLIPVPPLDGFKVVGGILPKELAYQWLQLERAGPILLLFLLFFILPAIQGPITSILKLLTLIFAGV